MLFENCAPLLGTKKYYYFKHIVRPIPVRGLAPHCVAGAARRSAAVSRAQACRIPAKTSGLLTGVDATGSGRLAEEPTSSNRDQLETASRGADRSGPPMPIQHAEPPASPFSRSRSRAGS